ncbi:ubiquinol oxidase subunit II [Dyella aluminiiresistens]|uniref:ubiquinol oxidase subunit II n=1 Tax=Dyella aluminiiresistens TaxID=3069105 RepID=UPI00399CEFAC
MKRLATSGTDRSLPRTRPGRRLGSRAACGLAPFLVCMTTLTLSGCHMALFDPKGSIGVQEKHLIIIASVLMLLVVVPVIALTLYFAWHYRKSNTQATYAPTWTHSTKIEVVVWVIPCLIVTCLAVLIWRSTHTLDPYRPVQSTAKPVNVDVIALNWKWLFIYPDEDIASVNRLVIPVGRPINFRITSDSIMNSFFIPRLGSQIYAMSGMQTRLHLIADTPGVYQGMSSSFSGPGFADMHFDTAATSEADFKRWVEQARHSKLVLTKAAYQALAAPSRNNPVESYSHVAAHLFEHVVDQYRRDVFPGRPPHPAIPLNPSAARVSE